MSTEGPPNTSIIVGILAVSLEPVSSVRDRLFSLSSSCLGRPPKPDSNFAPTPILLVPHQSDRFSPAPGWDAQSTRNSAVPQFRVVVVCS